MKLFRNSKSISNPHWAQSKIIAKRRIIFYAKLISVILAIELISLILTWWLVSNQVAQIISIVLIVIHLLITITYWVFFDFGPAQKLKKQNYQNGNLKIEKGQTFYFALKISSLWRLIINFLGIGLLIIFGILTFV